VVEETDGNLLGDGLNIGGPRNSALKLMAQ
jgi:hypothetical protein